MRIHAIKDSKVSVKKKLTIAASLTAVVILIVITYKRLEPKLLKYLKNKKRHHRAIKRHRAIKKQAINKEFDYNRYIESMAEMQESYEGQSSFWI